MLIKLDHISNRWFSPEDFEGKIDPTKDNRLCRCDDCVTAFKEKRGVNFQEAFDGMRVHIETLLGTSTERR